MEEVDERISSLGGERGDCGASVDEVLDDVVAGRFGGAEVVLPPGVVRRAADSGLAVRDGAIPEARDEMVGFLGSSEDPAFAGALERGVRFCILLVQGYM